MNPHNYIEYYSKEVDGLPDGRSIICDAHPKGTCKLPICDRGCPTCINGATTYQPSTLNRRNNIFIRLWKLNHEPE